MRLPSTTVVSPAPSPSALPPATISATILSGWNSSGARTRTALIVVSEIGFPIPISLQRRHHETEIDRPFACDADGRGGHADRVGRIRRRRARDAIVRLFRGLFGAGACLRAR